MITEQDLQEAIAECQGTRNPNANTCLKLASYYTIMDHMKGTNAEPMIYSYAKGPAEVDKVVYSGNSEFAQAIADRDISDIWPIMDELMETLSILQPRLYDGVMRKLHE